MWPTGFRTFHFVSFLYVFFFFSFLFLLFRFFSHYFVFVFLRFVSFRYFSPCFLFVFFLSVSFRFFSFFFPFLSLQVPEHFRRYELCRCWVVKEKKWKAVHYCLVICRVSSTDQIYHLAAKLSHSIGCNFFSPEKRRSENRFCCLFSESLGLSWVIIRIEIEMKSFVSLNENKALASF